MPKGRPPSIMKKQNIDYINQVKFRHRQQTGSNDWDDDYIIIRDLVKEYGTGMEDLIMSIYRKTIRNWEKVKDKPSLPQEYNRQKIFFPNKN